MNNSIAQEFHLGSLLKFALPSTLMMVFISLYAIIDGMFISRLVGTDALSAQNIVYPVLNCLMGPGIMLATGGSAIVARQLGEGRKDDARRNFTFFALIGVAVSLVFLVVCGAFLEPLCRMLGATPRLMQDAKDYLFYSLCFGPALMLQIYFQVFFVTAGHPALGLIATTLGGLTNAGLDFLFMGPLGMGLKGAAIATGLGQALMAVIGLVFFAFMRRGNLYFVRPQFGGAVLGEACANGSSEMVGNLSAAVVTFLFNMIMLDLLGEDGVAAITIVLYGQFLMNAVYMGFSMGVAPVLSFNHGGGNKPNLQRVYRISMRFIATISVLVLGVSVLFAAPIVRIFAAPDTQTYSLAVHGFVIFAINYLFAGINLFASSLFTAFSDGKVSAILSFLRTFGFIVACVLVLPHLLGVDGVWLAVPLAELLTLFVSLWFLRRKKSVYGY